MERKVEYFNGKEITGDVILRMKDIVSKSKKGFLIEDFVFETFEDLCDIHSTDPEQEFVILGNDWVISHYDFDDEVTISLWAGCEKVEDKFRQAMEMKKALKEVLLENARCRIFASMRRDTSYKFYESLLTRGYFEEEWNYVVVQDDLNNRSLHFSIEYIKYIYGSVEEFIKDFGIQNFPSGFDEYVYHRVSFGVTEKFVKQYKKG